MRISVRAAQGHGGQGQRLQLDTFALDVEASNSVLQLKAKVQDKVGSPVQSQCIMFAGNVLLDWKTLSDYDMQCESTVHLMVIVEASQVLDALSESGLLIQLLLQHSYRAVKDFAEYLCLMHKHATRSEEFSPMPEIDEVWHLALLNTREYQQVCHKCFGAMIHHSTRSASDPEPEKKRRRLHALQTIQDDIGANGSAHLAQDVPLDIEISFPFDGVESKRASRTWSAPVRWTTVQSEAEQFVKNVAANYLDVFPHEVVFGSDAKLLLYGDSGLIKAWRSKAPAGMVRIRYQVLDGDRVVSSSRIFNAPLTMQAVHAHVSALMAVTADRVHLVPFVSEDTPVVDMSVFKAWPKRDDEVPIHVKTLTGKTIQLLVTRDDTVLKIKQMLRLVEGCDDMDPLGIRLIFAGKMLEDGQTLASHGIQADSTVHWVLRLRGC